ncbi:MAG: glutamate synthase, partial [Burkholderiaceae bacterium]
NDGKHEIEHAQSEGIEIMQGWMPVKVIKGADGRATALLVKQCEAKMVGGKLDIKPIEGTEKELPADLIVSARGPTHQKTGGGAVDKSQGGGAGEGQN